MPLLLHRNKKLHYRAEGSGAALVLVHGFAEDSSIWSEQASLAQHCRLLLPDLPGSGGSEADAFSMEDLAEAIKAVLDAEGIERCTLVGHSMGGYAALAFAERWPERLNGLGLFHSTAYADTEEKIATRRKGISFIRERGAAAFLKASIPNLYSPKTREQKPELVEKQVAGATEFGAEALIGYYEAMIARPDHMDVLKEAKIPVLFVLGRNDNAVPLTDGLAQCHVPQCAQVHLLEDAGHMGMRECPGSANEYLNSFLRFVNQRMAAE
jgi:pimeloyl-ACP methyl ester carboxylesterase